jgi:HPr kinase/phosphorylase
MTGLSSMDPGRIAVRELMTDGEMTLPLRLLAGSAGLDRIVDHPRIQKSGLAMVGHLHGVVPTRIQVLGETELSYAESLTGEAQVAAARSLFSAGLSCVVVTRGAMPPECFVREAERTGTPVLSCEERSSVAIAAIHGFLDERLAPRARLHGVLVDIHEIGVLLLGQSGIGKSESALELVMRGHRLVADDVIECDFRPPDMIFGEPAGPLLHHMEVRGLGILNIKDLYGVTAVRERKRIDLVVRLELWQPNAVYDRIGLDERFFEILGVALREVRLPIQPGRNMSSIIEIAARAELLRRAGHHPARELVDRLERGWAVGGTTESSAPPPMRRGGRRTS